MERSDNGWTGGQYSVLRSGFALSAVLYALDAWVFASEGTVVQRWGAVALISLVSVPLALGTLDRLAAASLACLLLLHRFLLQAPEFFVAWPAFESVLLIHVFVPRAPYGSWSAMGRADPGGGWRLANRLHDGAWLVVGLSHLLAGVSTVMTPSWVELAGPMAWFVCVADLCFLPLALLPGGRPIALSLGLASLVTSPWDGNLALAVMAHMACFTPAWLAPAAGPPTPLFFDGECGLCHRAVRFFLAEDVRGDALSYAPLQSGSFESRVAPERRAGLPDSLVALTSEGGVLVRTEAVAHCLNRLGGGWRISSWILRLCPRILRDRAYDLVAASRQRFFRTPDDSCPLVPSSLRARFLD